MIKHTDKRLSLERIATRFAAHLPAGVLRQVELFAFTFRDLTPMLWVITDTPDLKTRFRIYDAELALFDESPNMALHVELICRQGYPLERFLSADRIAFSVDPRRAFTTPGGGDDP